MTGAYKLFQDAWARCDMLSLMHAYLAKTTTNAVETDELLRAEWVARVSALDLYMHELLAERMLEMFLGSRATTTAFLKFTLPMGTVSRIQTSPLDAGAAFDLEVRRHLGFETFQTHEAIANAVKLISGLELWNSIAMHQGAAPAQVQTTAKVLRGTLNAVADRRNKIAHEGDMQPGAPRVPWPIKPADLHEVRSFIGPLVESIEAIH